MTELGTATDGQALQAKGMPYSLEELLGALSDEPSEMITNLLGNLFSEIWTLRQMSTSIAGQLDRGATPALEASIVKDLGARFEQDLPQLVQAALGEDIDAGRSEALREVLDYLLQATPSRRSCACTRGAP